MKDETFLFISFHNNFVGLQVNFEERERDVGKKIVIVNVTWTNSCCLPNLSPSKSDKFIIFLLIEFSFSFERIHFQTNSW